jgi:Uri superfamily endonuclease
LKGIYLLMLALDDELADLAIGRLGRYNCAAGYYLYVGSAFGAGGLTARIAYHARMVKARPHWHIDYLRARARLIEVWCVGTSLRLECCWARGLAASPGVAVPIPGFGSSDNGCVSHLLYTARRPSPRLLTESLFDCFSGAHAPEFTVEITNYDA